MLPSNINVNKKLLPIKGHFFFFNAGTAPLVPYLSTYARQLGFSSGTVGLIYTVLPLFGLVAKPLFGVIADRFKIQKTIFLIFQVTTIISFLAIYFIPGKAAVSVELDCNNGITMLRSCYKTPELVDSCKVTTLGNQSVSASCQMNCDMTSPKMWQTVCEHWHIPQYCYSNTDSIQYSANLGKVTLRDQCAYVAVANVSMDGYEYTPGCRIGNGYVDVNASCRLNCSDSNLSTTFQERQANMTCEENNMSFRMCAHEGSGLEPFTNNTVLNEVCQVFCDLDKSSPWQLMEICEGWKADITETCHPRTDMDSHFPANLSFTGTVLLGTTISEHECVYLQLNHITLDDGTIRYPICMSKAQYQMETELFQTTCEIDCDNAKLNELFMSASESQLEETSKYTRQFWLFFMLMIASWVSQAVVVTFADAICFNLLVMTMFREIVEKMDERNRFDMMKFPTALGMILTRTGREKVASYGKQRLWGSVGWGIFSLLTGFLIDLFSDGAFKDYTVAFVLMAVFMAGDVIVSCFLKIDSTKMSMNILADVGTLLSSLPTFIFLLWTIAVGVCTGLIWQFLFWLLEDVSALTCDGSDYVKTLQGLVSAIQTFCGEIPFLFVSGYILKRVGHANMMSLVLFAFGVRFILYSFLTNPWWVLPIEVFQGITFGMFYPTLTSYATIVSPPGTETTVQGLVGAVFEGLGTSLGSFVGGRLYETYGGWNTFRWFGYGALVCCALHTIAQYFIKDKIALIGINKGYSAVHYEQPYDTVNILDNAEDKS